jgi:peptidyl-prolyl cis-trans isomerase D
MISWMQNNNKFTVIIMWIAALSFILSTAVIGGASGLRSNTIGKVGEIELKKDKFQMQYSQLFSQYNQMMQGKFDEKQAKAMGLQDQVLKNMAAQAKILNLAKEFGIVVTEKEIAQEITSIPAFGTDGKFDKKIYDTYLQNNRLTHETFENNFKDQLLVEKTFKMMDIKALENEYNAFKIAFEVGDKLKYTLLTKDDVNVTIDDAQLKTFWEPRKDQYKTPTKYTLEIQWTETKDTPVTDEEVKKYYDENRFNYTNKEGKISDFKDVKEWVKEATQIAKSKKNALKRYVKLKKGELSADETLTLNENDPKLSATVWNEIKNSSLNSLIKPKVVENRYASVKIVNIVNPITKTFDEVKPLITPLYQEEAERKAVSLLAEEKLTKIDNEDLNVSTFITLDNAETQKLGLNKQETAKFISELFTSDKEKGIIPIGSKVIVYKIIEQKLISLENNETEILHKNADKVKNQSFQVNLMKELDKKYPTKLY